MKKKALIVLCLLTALLSGCEIKEKSDTADTKGSTVNFINEICEADVWILPETEENLKTTVWGAATLSKTQTGEEYEIPLSEAGADGLYIFRMIDTEGFYYSANGIELKNGRTLTVKEEKGSIKLEVTDGNGNLKNMYEVFAAKL